MFVRSTPGLRPPRSLETGKFTFRRFVAGRLVIAVLRASSTMAVIVRFVRAAICRTCFKSSSSRSRVVLMHKSIRSRHQCVNAFKPAETFASATLPSYDHPR